MRIKIKPLRAEWADLVKSTLYENKEDFCKFDDTMLLATHFYQVTNKEKDLIAFFGLFYLEKEMVLSFVYVFDDYRKKNVFKQIVRFARLKTPRHSYCSIAPKRSNNLATFICCKRFNLSHYDQHRNCFWYIIKKRG